MSEPTATARDTFGFIRRACHVGALTLALVLLSAACGDPVEPPSDLIALSAPHFDFLNGPHDLPNVFRAEGPFSAFFVIDEEEDLISITHLPFELGRHVRCGGDQGVDFIAWHVSGTMQEVIQLLEKSNEASIHVWDLSTFDFSQPACAQTPIASGTGRVIGTDNDLRVSGTRANSYGFRAVGTLKSITGEILRYTAVAKFIIDKNGVDNELVSKINMHPMGK